ncbi:MAG TPA: c-type cytochrome, partial [Sinorhizobium sp.]|nr:c-type cytochrome [Sinorhizobium sp.]
MDLKELPRTTIAKVLGIAAGSLMLAGAVFVLSGIYNVAASTDHLRVTTWILELLRERSIATRSFPIEAPPLDDHGMIRLGAAHFEGGCAPCHGRPGEGINPIAGGMQPAPTDLRDVAERRPPEEIFWIVRHGLKYTGMPAWPNTSRDDEVWTVTAFLARLPAAGEYADLAGLARGARDSDEGMATRRALMRCDRCHDSESTDTNGDRIPRLAGLPEAYLLRSLGDYARRTRASGMMEPVADLLDESERRALAARYAALRPAARKASAPADREQLRRGEAIATRGIPEQQVPACMSCHSGRQSSQFPL